MVPVNLTTEDRRVIVKAIDMAFDVGDDYWTEELIQAAKGVLVKLAEADKEEARR